VLTAIYIERYGLPIPELPTPPNGKSGISGWIVQSLFQERSFSNRVRPVERSLHLEVGLAGVPSGAVKHNATTQDIRPRMTTWSGRLSKRSFSEPL
jgi:hypothetical protein